MASNIYVRTGTAIIEISRIRKSCKNKRFLSNYFSADEIRFFVSHKLSTALIAENYCVKIAVAKAIGTGMRVIRAQDITVLRDRLGSPFVIAEGYLKLLEEREGYVFNVSVDHCRKYATASVIVNK
ncbi:MAG: 4'-phosphopantetheinyl transferase superfamily protein [Lachnospiraceae bacterium]|nr:4'-phosphopantetheinyl transferase superfamily protein [Ruminococcus sp.]MCM1275743.1 4'-phosphopantetheinyl transferase superfamily protein [Lachnospiraceae bacterium]